MRRLLLLLSILATLSLGSCSTKGQESLQLHSEADLAGLHVATIAGSCYDIDLSKRNDITLILYNYEADMLESLLIGKSDVIVTDEIIFNANICRETGIKIAMKGTEKFPSAFMFRKTDRDLVEAVNATQRRMVEDGTMARLEKFWLEDEYLNAAYFTHIPEETSGTPIRFATISSMAPISFVVEDNWYGIETELAREIAKDLHRPVEFKMYDISSAMMALKTGKADVVMGAIFITPERQEQFLFAEPYHDYSSAYYVIDRDAARNKVAFWKGFKKSIRQNFIQENRWKYITSGLWETIKITFFAILLGSALGVFLCAMTRSRRKWVRSIAGTYNWLMAGIPMLVLLLILFYVVFAGTSLNATIVAIIAFALNFASGASGVYDTALSAIPVGQTEAGLALGFTRLQTFFHIVFPQALKHGLPLYQAQCISLLKGTSIVGYIAIQDLTRAGDIIRSRTFDALLPLLMVTVFYFILAWLIGLLLQSTLPKKKSL
jgi:polar amino acid transport system substrate-binding protein